MSVSQGRHAGRERANPGLFSLNRLRGSELAGWGGLRAVD